MKEILWVGLGGSIGAMMRLGLSSALNSKEGFPYGTLVANALGCFLLGFFGVYLNSKVPTPWKPFITTGCLGALTTFSTFSFETLQFILRAQWKTALFYLFLQILLGLSLSLLGLKIGQYVTHS